MALKMETYIILLILSSLKYDWTIEGGFKLKSTLDVISRASGYGGSVTLLCKFEGCCSTYAAWEVWEKGSDDNFRPIFTDITNLRSSNASKYDGSIRPDGYTLVIRNLSKADLNMNYTCTYGSYRSDKKLLLEDDVFHKESYTSETTRNPINDNGVRLGISVVVAIMVILVIVVSILFCWYRRCRRKSRTTLKEPDQIENNEEIESLTNEPDQIEHDEEIESLTNETEKNYGKYHGKTLPKDVVKIFCLCSNSNSDKAYARELRRKLTNFGFKSKNIKSNVDFLPGKLFYKIPPESLNGVLKLIIIISNEYELDGHFSEVVDIIVNKFSNEHKFADIIPILRSERVEIPRCLSNRTSFSVVTDSYSKLFDGLLQCPIIQSIGSFEVSLIDNNKKFSALPQHITEIYIKPDKLKCFEHEKQLVIGILDDWGVHIVNERLTIRMDKIQKYSQNRQFCLGDMFASRIRYIKRIDFLRLYGVEHFDIKELKLHSQMEKHVTGVFYKLINKLNEETYWWYHYRRNALRPVGSNEDTFRLMKQVFQDGEPVIVFQKFKTYESRLATFSEYPVGNQSFKENMAHAGFFYFNVADYVQCFSCGGCLYKWSKTHKPEKRHKAYFRNCHFIKKICPENVSESDINGLCNGEMETFEGRTDSFKQFNQQYPAQKNITQDDISRLADDGFYYCGIAEDIACYACDIGFATMQYSTNICKAHKKHYPYCPHVKEKLIQISENTESEQVLEEKDFEPYLELEYHVHLPSFVC